MSSSHSEKKSLAATSNVVFRRMIDYTEKKPDLYLSFLAVDATDKTSMSDILQTIVQDDLDGCILLTAVFADGVFSHLKENDFTSVYATKLGALETLKKWWSFMRWNFSLHLHLCLVSLDVADRPTMAREYLFIYSLDVAINLNTFVVPTPLSRRKSCIMLTRFRSLFWEFSMPR